MNSTDTNNLQFESLKIYRDYKNTIDSAFDEGKIEGKAEGKAEGKIEGKIEIAIEMKKLGITTEVISKVIGLSEDEIDNL